MLAACSTRTPTAGLESLVYIPVFLLQYLDDSLVLCLLAAYSTLLNVDFPQSSDKLLKYHRTELLGKFILLLRVPLRIQGDQRAVKN